MGLFSRKPKRLVLPLGEVVWGYTFDDDRHVAAAALKFGKQVELELRRQRDNRGYPNSVQLHSDAGPVAYLPEENAISYGRILDRIGRPLFAQAMLRKLPGGQVVEVSLPSARAASEWLKKQGVQA